MISSSTVASFQSAESMSACHHCDNYSTALITQQSSSSVPAAAAAVLDYMYIDLSIPELYTYIEYVVGQ